MKGCVCHKYNNSINYPFGLSLLVLFLLNAFHRTNYQCNTFFSEFVIAPIVGLSVGLLAVYIMVYSDNKALLYYDELVSNKQSCGRPQKQYYKCTIKKDDGSEDHSLHKPIEEIINEQINLKKENEYNCQAYINRYPDLQTAYGADCNNKSTAYGARMHWLVYGQEEGRNASPN